MDGPITEATAHRSPAAGTCRREQDKSAHVNLDLRGRAIKGLEQALLSGVAAALAWGPTQAVGMREGFWAAITAVAVAQSELGAASSTGRDQSMGALIGGAVAAATSIGLGMHAWSFAVAASVAIFVCWLFDIATASRLAGITAAIILLVPGLGSAEQVMVSRVGEVIWGTLMAITVVWFVNRARRVLNIPDR